ncbi:MAG: bifunctional adenosylcobinamide kinase/adenosylcobinamide-phosphate guanylyltransferase [Oscillospiraceae bacterium]|nr:bifunctional adenosylcobinamide kinase/adenosylcobinamide-phosphate guanylyltransferase [Oscillospiraceae bacterium]
MLTLIIGGAGSGKSAFAEALVCRLPGERIYLATMERESRESLARIEKHRAQRAGLGFQTVERCLNLADVPIPEGGNVLLEDLSNLLANETFLPEGRGTEAVREGLAALRQRSRHLTVVTNEIFSGGTAYAAETLRFIRELAMMNLELAGEADLAVELVCGIPNVLRGELPCLF